MDTSKCRLTLAVRLPRVNDGARNGHPANCKHAPLDEHILAFSLRRDRLAKQDCRYSKCKCRAVRICCEVSTSHAGKKKRPERERERRIYARSGVSSVKNGPRRVLSVAFATRGLLSLSTRAVTPNTSEN